MIGNSQNQTKEYARRYLLFYIITTALISLLIFRLWHLQIISGEQLKTFSEKNSLKKTRVAAPRGLVLDRDNNLLINNLSGFMVTISPQYTSDLSDLASALEPVLGIEKSEIASKVKKSRRRNGPFLPVAIKKNLSREEVYKLKRLRVDYSGLEIEETQLRNYLLGENGAQLFGFVRQISRDEIKKFSTRYKDLNFEPGDIIGKKGLELSAETTLKGINGADFIEVDARGRKTYKSSSKFLNMEPKPPIPGHSLVLTLDKDIQEAAYKAFQRDDWVGNRVGSILVMKNTGEILAWVSTPSFDPNNFSTGISSKLWSKLTNHPHEPLRNRVIQNHYSPGSTIKPIIALAALQEKIVGPYTKVYSPGNYKLGNATFHDSHREGHGNINVIEAIEASSNVFFYKAGQTLGIDRIHRYAKLFDLGEKTNLNIGYEVPGRIPSRDWKKKALGEVWTPGETLITAIGQGFVLTTGLQMAKAYNIIAQDGLVYKPYLIKKILDHNNNVIKTFEPQIITDITKPTEERDTYIKKEYFKYVQKGMRDVFHGENGTATWYKIKNFEMAGKTGTTQVKRFSSKNIYKRCKDKPAKYRHHGWFVGYAPYKNPEITIAVLAEHSCSGALGGAGPFKDIVLAYLEKYKPDVFLKTQNIKKVGAVTNE